MKDTDFFDKIYCCDVIQGLKKLPDNSVDCCVTSPPYYALRDYGVDGQIGLEQTPQKYIEKLTDVFSEVYRVLKEYGTLWVNISDSYWGGGWRGAELNKHSGDIQKGSKGTHCGENMPSLKGTNGVYKDKDLIGIPWMLAFALRDKVGYYLRQDIIWAKGSCMPESVTDRCTKSHEYIFLFSKSKKYYYDYEAIMEPCADQSRKNYQAGGRVGGQNKNRNDNDLSERSKTWQPRTKNLQYDSQTPNTMHINREIGIPDKQYTVRNKRDVWHVNTCPDPCAHFAVYPEKLIEPCILAGCPKDGVVLDPFMGSGTTAKVAQRFDRHYVGFEINPEYVEIAKKKLSAVQKELFV